ncbi:MAG: tRNA guanosine(34) transglycosylase Tgt [Myxococcota bacterium]
MTSRPIAFELLNADGATEARRGRLRTLHGEIETPVFMPVGTLASVKTLDDYDLERLGAGIILNNAYHLMLRPGDDMVARRGGLHRFSNYRGAILTDSGGFQVFSLEGFRKVTDEGVEFRSHIDGSLHHLTPERLVEVQENLRPDIAMVLDECPPGDADRERVIRATDRSTAWATRAVAARSRDDVAWFGIVQGGLHADLRRDHAEVIAAMDFDGVAIGGVSVGESPEDIDRIVCLTAPLLPAHKPRYLMGVGTPQDLIRGVASGVDMFDCVMPTRNARNGTLFTWRGKVNIKRAEYREDDAPLDPETPCYVSREYSRAYLRHLYAASEPTFLRLATLHNVAFYLSLMARIRADLDAGRFDPDALLSQLQP